MKLLVLIGLTLCLGLTACTGKSPSQSQGGTQSPSENSPPTKPNGDVNSSASSSTTLNPQNPVSNSTSTTPSQNGSSTKPSDSTNVTLTVQSLDSVVAKRVLAWGNTKPIEWDRSLLKAVLEYPLNPKVKSLCTKTKDVKLCWAKLISKASYHESKWDPSVKFEECSSKKGTYGSNGVYVKSLNKYCMMSNGEIVTSRGLMQISKDSANSSRYNCGIVDSKDLHIPAKNLECTVKISGYQINKAGVLMGEEKLGMAAYWSVCRKFKDGKIKDSWTLIDNYLKAQ